MKVVLISIKPKWCKLIASGKKTVEVRKTKPKLDAPFKCYIYCTKNGDYIYRARVNENRLAIAELWNGKVIGEFVCNEIETLNERDLFEGMDEISNSRIENYSCLSIDELLQYKGEKKEIYGWHISDLVIYDKPRELSEFCRECDYEKDCGDCPYLYVENTPNCYETWCEVYGHIPIKRPPQSWCYVEI